jgi:hypothetical protein
VSGAAIASLERARGIYLESVKRSIGLDDEKRAKSQTRILVAIARKIEALRAEERAA